MTECVVKLVILSFIVSLLCVLPAHAQEHEQYINGCRKGDVELIATMLSLEPAFVDLPDAEGNTGLIVASYAGHPQLVEHMASLSQNIDYASSYGTALMAAAVKGHAEIAGTLLAHGASTNISDAQGNTALTFATMFQHDALAALLLKAGADPLRKNAQGYSALDYARMQQKTELIILFENYKP